MERKPSRHQRRHAGRQLMKNSRPLVARNANVPIHGGAWPPKGSTLTGVLLADGLPTHERGSWRLGAGWVSDLDTIAWREAAHAIVSLSFGWQVLRLAIAERDAPDAANTGCEFRATGSVDEMAENYRRVAVGVWAGPDVVSHIRKEALDLPHPLPSEGVAEQGQRLLADAATHVPESAADLRLISGGRAVGILLKYKAQFGALVREVLERRTLNQADVLRIWETDNPEPGPPRSLAEYTPTHDLDCVMRVPTLVTPGYWPVAPDRWVSTRDLGTWHEAAHAVVFLALGWHVWEVVLAPDLELRPPDEGLSPGRCRVQAPSAQDAMQQLHARALAGVAGSVVVQTLMEAFGLRGQHYADQLSGPDLEGVTLYREALGIAPEDAADFEQGIRDEAAALLQAHRHAFGALTRALLVHGTLYAFEVLEVWRTGAFRFAGRISEIPRCVDGPEDLADPGWRGQLRERFGCTAA